MRTNSKRRKPWGSIVLLSLCAATTFFFLLRREDSPYDFATSAGVFRERSISAYTYHFVWPQSKRDYVRKMEDAYLPIYLMLQGYPETSLTDEMLKSLRNEGRNPMGGPLPSTLTYLMERNMVITTFLGIITVAVGVALLVFRRLKRNGDQATLADEPLS
jgi:hypothetical protein